MERECLTILLRGRQPIVVCLAKRLAGSRLPREYQKPLAEGRLLILSPFADSVKRITAETARVRNAFVAVLANKVFVAYAAPDGKTEHFCRNVLDWDKPLLTFDDNANSTLITLGARPIRSGDFYILS